VPGPHCCETRIARSNAGRKGWRSPASCVASRRGHYLANTAQRHSKSPTFWEFHAELTDELKIDHALKLVVFIVPPLMIRRCSFLQVKRTRGAGVVEESRNLLRHYLAWRRVFGAPLVVAALCALTMNPAIASASTIVSIDVRSACAAGSSCTLFNVAVTNSTTATLNGLSVEVLGGTVINLQVNGYLTTLCQQNSAHGGFVCFPFSLSPGATLRASGRTGAPLTSATQFRFYTTSNGFATSTGQTVPLASGSGYPLTTPVVVGTSGPSGAGLLIGSGVAILLVGAGGFGAVVVARRRRSPAKCAAALDSLKTAETALRHWETAIQSVQRDATSSPDDANVAENLLKVREGHESAVRFRDQCQLNVIECMTSTD
jgi:hypothetical protein